MTLIGVFLNAFSHFYWDMIEKIVRHSKRICDHLIYVYIVKGFPSLSNLTHSSGLYIYLSFFGGSGGIAFKFSFVKDFIYSLFDFWLHWALVAARMFSSCGEQGCSGFSFWWPLVQSTGSRTRDHSCGAWAWLPTESGIFPGSGIDPVSPASAGGFLTTGFLTRDVPKFYSFSKFQLLSTVLSTVITTLYIRSSDSVHLVTTSLYLLPSSPRFPHLPAPGNHFYTLFLGSSSLFYVFRILILSLWWRDFWCNWQESLSILFFSAPSSLLCLEVWCTWIGSGTQWNCVSRCVYLCVCIGSRVHIRLSERSLVSSADFLQG